jgi:hypothetical protein
MSSKGGQRGVKNLLLTIGLDLGAFFVILARDKPSPGDIALQKAPAHLEFTLPGVECGSSGNTVDRYEFLLFFRTFERSL